MLLFIFILIKPLKLRDYISTSFIIIVNAIIGNREDSLRLGEAGRIIYLTYTRLSPALSEGKTCSRSMCYDVATNRFLVICGEHGGAIHLGNDLICHDHCNTEFVSKSLEVSKEFRETHLSCA